MKKSLIIIGIILVITIIVYLIVVFLNMLKTGPGDAVKNQLSPNIEARLETIQKRVREMGEDEINFWKRYGPDSVQGGFFGKVGRKGNGDPNADKGLIQQTRHLITFSLWYRYRDSSEEIKAIADAQYDYIIKMFYDASKQDFCARISADGTPKNEKKSLYAESFAIYCLSLYAFTFDNSEAERLALKCFHAMDERLHDDTHGGFDQTNDARGLPESVGKETNTHMHLLESISTLYEATGDPLSKQRLEEMIRVFSEKILQPDNYCHTLFGIDWTPYGEHYVEYGHDLQTAWLMMNAARVLNRMEDNDIRNAVLAMGINSSGEGFDTEGGGYYYTGMVHGEITKESKDWWVQAESLSGLWWVFYLTGDTVHLDRLEKTLDWIENNLADSEYGGWYARLNSEGFPANDGYKSDYWKSSYHSSRALILLDKWIDDYLK